MHPVNKGLVPIHYKYFVRNLTLHHFLLSPEAWNMRISINLPSYTSGKPDSVATFSSRIKSRNGKKLIQNNLEWQPCLQNTLEYSSMSAVSPHVGHSAVKHLQAWMFHASGIILYMFQIVCSFNLKILFNK